MKALVVGEALVDVVARPGEEPQAFPGGSPANVAIGLARLGHTAELLTWLGPDEYGTIVRDHLAASGVSIVPGSHDAASTSVALARIGEDGSAQYEFDLTIDYPDHVIDDDVLTVHVGSIGAVLDPGHEKVRALLESARGQATVSYDPNLRPSIMGSPDAVRERVLGLIALSDLVKVSDEDLGWLEPDRDPHEIIREWAQLGPAITVVTRGGEGALAVTSAGAEYDLPPQQVTVADTVGAGDSFMGGLISGLWNAGLLGAANRERLAAISTDELDALLNRCARIASITVSRPGANPPTAAELGEEVPAELSPVAPVLDEKAAAIESGLDAAPIAESADDPASGLEGKPGDAHESGHDA
ncbi:carbohydrate kinase family protein [Salana multivorans]